MKILGNIVFDTLYHFDLVWYCFHHIIVWFAVFGLAIGYCLKIDFATDCILLYDKNTYIRSITAFTIARLLDGGYWSSTRSLWTISSSMCLG